MSKDYLEIKNYKFEKDIGEGNFGKVKLGIFKPTGEEFAIKILNKSKIKIKMKNSIFKENEIITRFNHINVVYVFQILEDSQNFYIIMEYCKHGELFDYIVKNEKLSEDEASIFFYQLINGIEYIHSKGISHRDLKPENLLLAENKVLKIIDFGLSHEFEGDELLKTKCGSPSYAAPEIICCPLYDGFKVDIWCCGIILYAMLCGYLPFEGEDNNLLFQNILKCNPVLPSFLSELSKDIISQILTPDPDYRITIENIKRHSFYLKGKKLCKIDYDIIENDIIKKRSKFSKSNIKKYYMDNKSDTNLNDFNKITKSDKYFLTINNVNPNNDKSKKGINLISFEHNNKSGKSKSKNKNSSKNLKSNFSAKTFKRRKTDINNKFNKRIETITNKIQEILKTEINDINKKISRPLSSHKNIFNNHKINPNGNKNIAITSNNINSINIYNNKKKENNPTFIDLISNNKDNKTLKNDIFIKLLDSTKFFNIYNEKHGFIKNDTYKRNLDKNKNDDRSRKILNNKKKKNDNGTLFNNFKTHLQKNNNKTRINYNLDNIIALSNDNIIDLEKYQNTCNNKNSQRINLFKESIKTEKNKGKNSHFNFKRSLSKYDKKIEKSKNSQTLKSPKEARKTNSYNNSTKTNKTKALNICVPNSTFYYNNININIKELNINPKASKNTKNILSSLVANPKIKSPCQTKRNYNNTKPEHRKLIKNKAFSAKRLFSYNINTHNIDNFKSTINNFNNDNLYTISNNNNRHIFINTINAITSNENNNGKMIKHKNNLYGLSKNIRLVYSEKNFNLFKNGGILSTEPKEILKKQFSYDKTLTNKNNDDDINNKNIKYKTKRSNTERMIKCKTINTESGRTRFKNSTNKKNKKNSHKNGIQVELHKKMGKFNNLDEMILYMYMEQKNNEKNSKLINKNDFKKWHFEK
jgi:5'-AMP-activated protein kinase catalytic alpha subunit